MSGFDFGVIRSAGQMGFLYRHQAVMRFRQIGTQRIQAEACRACNHTEFALPVPLGMVFLGKAIGTTLAENPAKIFSDQISCGLAAMHRRAHEHHTTRWNFHTHFEHAQNYKTAETVADQVQLFRLKTSDVIRQPLGVGTHRLQHSMVVKLMSVETCLAHAQTQQ